MALETQVQKDIMEAMKAKDTVRLNAVRSIKSAILLAKTAEGASKDLQDSDILKLIQKLAKQRKEAAEQYAAAGRQELADNELAEAAVLETYLPKMLSEQEVEDRLKEIIAEVRKTQEAYWKARSQFENYFREVNKVTLRQVMTKYGTILTQIAPEWYKDCKQACGLCQPAEGESPEKVNSAES